MPITVLGGGVAVVAVVRISICLRVGGGLSNGLGLSLSLPLHDVDGATGVGVVAGSVGVVAVGGVGGGGVVAVGVGGEGVASVSSISVSSVQVAGISLGIGGHAGGQANHNGKLKHGCCH